jgi:hypothetical protein
MVHRGKSMTKATFTVGVFGLPCRKNKNNQLCIMVNVRTDQEKQRALAGLPVDSLVKIIDALGGGVELEDFPDIKDASFFKVLEREIAEETGGCTIKSFADFSGPFMIVTNNQDEGKPTGDIAFWMPIILTGNPQQSDEAAEHVWITREEFESQSKYRCVGKLGNLGRTGRMIRAAFEFSFAFPFLPKNEQ